MIHDLYCYIHLIIVTQQCIVNKQFVAIAPLQGFIHVPKKPGGLKPELIDVDLVIGMLIFVAT